MKKTKVKQIEKISKNYGLITIKVILVLLLIAELIFAGALLFMGAY